MEGNNLMADEELPNTVSPAERVRALRRRYLSLGCGELVAAAVFGFVATRLDFIADDNATLALWFALAPLLFILVQAGIYWLAARTWVPGRMPKPTAQVYRILRVLNPILLFAAGIGMVVNLPGLALSIVVVTVTWLFAVVEYVNYFLVRLSYPWTTWVSQICRRSTPRLVRDLRAGL